MEEDGSRTGRDKGKFGKDFSELAVRVGRGKVFYICLVEINSMSQHTPSGEFGVLKDSPVRELVTGDTGFRTFTVSIVRAG